MSASVPTPRRSLSGSAWRRPAPPALRRDRQDDIRRAMPLSIIGIDADDTLWHNETIFRFTHKRFSDLLAEFADEDAIEAKLASVERENMKTYGYGAKGFTLSMIQTALEISKGAASPRVIQEILQAGREMMTHPIEP